MFNCSFGEGDRCSGCLGKAAWGRHGMEGGGGSPVLKGEGVGSVLSPWEILGAGSAVAEEMRRRCVVHK